LAKKQKEKKSTNIFDLGPIPKGIDSTLAFPTSFSKKDKKNIGFDF